jgi:hypothetical protein
MATSKKSANKGRTKIKDLPVPEKELSKSEKEKIKGGTDPFGVPPSPKPLGDCN